VARGVQLRFAPTATRTGIPTVLDITENRVTREVIVPAQGQWTGCIEVVPVIESSLVLPRYRCGQAVDQAMPPSAWPSGASRSPHHDRARGPAHRRRRSAEDLGALRIFDPTTRRVVVAAGAPWFMTVFGRDSLLTAWSALLVDPDLARASSRRSHASRDQGRPRQDEEPGRILHEMRFGGAASLSLGGEHLLRLGRRTPLFVMLLGELRRWASQPSW